jgi:peptidoglycan/xylan/chitin deacetylase (PgdA/CDA1 family)
MNNGVNNKGNFIISLDFEIYWGVWDVVDFHQYKNNLLGVREVIPRLLKVFHEYEIKATFATVGLLFFKDRQELEEGLPIERPAYTNAKISPYKTHLSEVGTSESDDPFHYAPSLIELIQNSGQEIACHTFCHYYCLEQGQTVETFAADLRAAKKIAVKRGIDLKSLVFPRNQFNEQYIEVCKNEGFTSFRGNEASWIYKAHIHERETLIRRVSRWLDAYINLTGHHCFEVERDKGFPVDIPASRFVRA